MASIGNSRTGMRNQGSIADLIVKGAIALVTAAFFIGAYLQFQVTFWLALIAALSVYITLLMLHTLMRRSERVDALVSEVTRLESELASSKRPAPVSTCRRRAARSLPPALPDRRALRCRRVSTPSSCLAPESCLRRHPPAPAAAPPPLGHMRPAASAQAAPAPFSSPAPEPLAPRSDLSPNLPPWPSRRGRAGAHARLLVVPPGAVAVF